MMHPGLADNIFPSTTQYSIVAFSRYSLVQELNTQSHSGCHEPPPVEFTTSDLNATTLLLTILPQIAIILNIQFPSHIASPSAIADTIKAAWEAASCVRTFSHKSSSTSPIHRPDAMRSTHTTISDPKFVTLEFQIHSCNVQTLEFWNGNTSSMNWATAIPRC